MGLHAHFPAYDYDDMVRSQRMMLDDLKVDHLRLILGTSMGCMQSFVWGETYPDFADALAPFACLPVQLAGRNRMMRYMAIQAIKQDPAWMDGEYKTEPIQGLRTATELLLVMGSSPLQMQKQAPTRELAEKYVDDYLKRVNNTDANDLIFYVNASRNYDPSPHLDRITAPVLWINSADDYINPPELGIAETMVKRMPHARFILLPISDATRGHGTHTVASVWKDYLAEFMRCYRAQTVGVAPIPVANRRCSYTGNCGAQLRGLSRIESLGRTEKIYIRASWPGSRRRMPNERQRLLAVTILAGGFCGLAAVAFHRCIGWAEALLIDQRQRRARPQLDCLDHPYARARWPHRRRRTHLLRARGGRQRNPASQSCLRASFRALSR